MRAYKIGKTGAWQVSFMDDGKQKTLYLGIKQTEASASRIAGLVAEILNARLRGEGLTFDLVRRVELLPKKIRESMKRLGLFSGRLTLPLGELCKEHAESKAYTKETTRKFYRIWHNNLQAYFGYDFEISDMTVEKAMEFRAYCLEHQAPATISRGVRGCRNLFDFAIEKGCIYENPFKSVPSGREVNHSRHYYVRRKTVQQLLEVCRNDRERLVVVLGRFAGVRIPSEIRYMRFRDFGNTTIRIHEDTKTGSRDVPLFEEIREIFERLKGEPDELIFGTRFRSPKSGWNLLDRLIQWSGVERWEKIWTNMRSSRITELMKMGYSEKTLDSIFGNSAKVRAEHYEQFHKVAEYDRVLSDSRLTVEYLRSMGGTFNETETPYFVREVTELVKTLVLKMER